MSSQLTLGVPSTNPRLATYWPVMIYESRIPYSGYKRRPAGSYSRAQLIRSQRFFSREYDTLESTNELYTVEGVVKLDHWG